MFCNFDIFNRKRRAVSGLCGLAVIFFLLTANLAQAANESFEKALEAARRADWDAAAELAEAAVNQDPGLAGAWALLADAQLNLGDTTAAVSSYQRALSEDPKNGTAVMGLTRHYLRSNQVAEADKVVAAAEEKDKKGKNDEIKVARGMVLAQQGKFAEARTIITSAAAKNPKNALYPWVLARIYSDQHVVDLAEENYAKAWALDPGNATLAFEYGVVLQEQKKYNEALDLFKVVQEKDPENKTVDFLVGRLYFAAKRWAEAASQFEKAVEKRPDHFLSNMLLGRSYVELSKAEKKNFYNRAIPPLRKALELRPDRADAKVLLADAMLSQSRSMFALGQADSLKGAESAYYDSSIVMAREAIAFDSSIHGAHGQMARAFDKKGMLDSAAHHAEIEVRVNPDDRNELTRLVNIYQRQKKQASLAQLLEPLMQDSAYFERFGLILVNAYSETNDFAKAKELVQQVLAKDPSNCNAHQTYAYIVLKRERYGEAIGVLQAGVKACPKDCDMWVQLGDSYYFSDPKSKQAVTNARDAYARASQLGCSDGTEKKEQVETILSRPGLK